MLNVLAGPVPRALGVGRRIAHASVFPAPLPCLPRPSALLKSPPARTLLARSSQEGNNSSQTPSEAPKDRADAAESSSQSAPGSETKVVESTSQSTPSETKPQENLPGIWGAITAFFLSLVAAVKQLPIWAQRKQLQRLKEQTVEDPSSVDKHVAYLAGLNQAGQHAEVMQRVESRAFPSGSPVIVEYLRALVSSGKVSDFASASAIPAESEDHRSLTQLLRELQEQVDKEQPDQHPGSSHRRPLHIAVRGMPLTMQPQKMGVWKVFWTLLQTASVVLSLAFFWIIGTYVLQRIKVTSSPATATATSVTTSSSTSSSPAVSSDPKEYKKDEIPEKSSRLFKDVKGCDEAKEELEEVVEFLKDPHKFTKMGAKLPKGVLLTGPPGTGKTLLARAVAGEAGVPFFYRAGSEFEELYVGVGSRRMRALFQAAKKKSPCIVFIDEIDAIGGNRKHWENNSRKTLNQLLTEMDGFESNDGVIVLAATNLPETLDPALKRPGRFDRQVVVPLPDIQGRTEILEYYLNDKPVAEGVDRVSIARRTQGFSGADLSNLVNEAAIMAAKASAELITSAMIDHAYDKIHMGVERKSVRRTEASRKKTAYHEAGHAIIAMVTPGANPIHKATIMPRGNALGMVSHAGREDEFSLNYDQMLAHIRVCMGGTVAEEIIFGKPNVSTGATDDLRQATSMARHLVMQCGLSEIIGPIYVSDEKLLSEDFKQRVDAEVLRILKEARQATVELLKAKEQDLHNLATALLEHETLTLTDIQEVLAGTFQRPAPPSPPESSQGKGEDRVDTEETSIEGVAEAGETQAVLVANNESGTKD